MKKISHSLLITIVASAMLLLASASQHEPIGEPGAFQIRALLATGSSAPVSVESTTTAPTSTQVPTSTVATSSTAVAITTSSSSAAAPKVETSSSVAGAAPTTSAGSTPTSTAHLVTSSVVATTDSAGQVVTSYAVYTPTPSSAAPSSTQTSDNSGSSNGGGLGTGSIIGLSVSGGIAVIGIILFFVWKFTRQRFADFDDNEAIKWPELNSHNNDVHALPTNSTGRSGFGAENDSDVNLTRAPSPGAYANSIAASSVPDVYGAGDPYAVPPLPHLNPNQPYRDEPGTLYDQPAGFYDPYRGSVPPTFADTVSDGHGAESIPMTQMARVRSPGPQMVYDVQGRASPAPRATVGYASMDERPGTPNFAALGTGRASPSPGPGYGLR